MKTKQFFIVLIMALFASCTPPDPNDDTNDDTSPGVDEYFRVDINSQHWAVEDDETIGAVLTDFGSGPKYGLDAVNSTDTTHFFYSIPYFYSNDTAWSLNPTPTNMAIMYYDTDSVYSGTSSGTLHIQRSNVGGMEVFTGTFNYTGLTIIHQTPASFTGGEFVIARLL